MTAKSLILHIGDPKTGTTSIQEVLGFGRWKSPSVKVEFTEQLNSFPLANALCNPKQKNHRVTRYSEVAVWLERSDADVAIISAEQFYRVNPVELMATLREFLPRFADSVRVVAYVRPHVSRMIAAYMQRTKSGLWLGTVESLFESTKSQGLLQFMPRFQTWRDTFGDHFTLRPMIRSQLHGGDVVADFMNFALQGEPVELLGGGNVNASLTLETLAGLREVQSILKKNNIPPGTRNYVGDHVGRTLAATNRLNGTRLKISQDLYQGLRDYCADDAVALDSAFFGAPLMRQALDEAHADVVPVRQRHATSNYYSHRTILALRERATSLVEPFKAYPDVWTKAFERKVGQRPGPEIDVTLKKSAKSHIREINRAVTEIADLIGNYVALDNAS